MSQDQDNANIRVEITNPSEFHCFRLVLNPKDQGGIEIMLHARTLVDLVHKCSLALCEWQAETSKQLILQKTGFSEDEARKAGLIP